MFHRNFRIICSVFLLGILSFVVSYDCLKLNYIFPTPTLIVKIGPLFFMMIINALYFILYRFTIYSIFMFITLFFSFLGDLFMGLYDSKEPVYIICGGAAFFIARISLLTNFMIYPSSPLRLIRHDCLNTVFSHILFTTPFILVGIFLLDGTVISILNLLYFILGFGFQLSYSFLRIRAIEEESKFSTVIAFTGMLLFNIADCFLLISIFTTVLPPYWIVISDNIYWTSMYLLTISILRTSGPDNERFLLPV